MGVTRVLQGCYKGVTRVLQGCNNIPMTATTLSSALSQSECNCVRVCVCVRVRVRGMHPYVCVLGWCECPQCNRAVAMHVRAPRLHKHSHLL
jgi:hypothetical protein